MKPNKIEKTTEVVIKNATGFYNPLMIVAGSRTEKIQRKKKTQFCLGKSHNLLLGVICLICMKSL